MKNINDEKTIKEYELLKAYYLKKVKAISEKKFQEIRSELGVSEEIYFSIEFFSDECDKCKEYFLYNAFEPIICPYCGKEIESQILKFPIQEENISYKCKN